MTKQPSEIYVIGASGHAKVAISAATLSGVRVVCAFDDDAEKIGTLIGGVPVVGTTHSILRYPPLPTLIAIGNNRQRVQLADQLPLSWATICHPSAFIDPSARIGNGALILAGAVVQADAVIGEHVIINDNATVEHDCRVERGTHISCNACLTGGVHVAAGAMIGAGAVVLPEVKVGEFAIVGAGTVALKDVRAKATVVGAPAREVNANEQLIPDDSARQHNPRIFLSPPHMASRERSLLLDAFDSNWIAPLGPHVDAFEAEFARRVGASHAVAVSSGTAALHLALLAVGVKPGDAVLTSTLTFIATANAIRYTGAEPVFIDSEWKSWNLDPNLLEEELSASAERGRLPSALVVVDVFGQCADYRAIQEICRRFEVPIVEDAAESLGSEYFGRSAGTLGDIGCFSFNGNKIITTSGGGMVVTENAAWAQQIRQLATQARLPGPVYQHEQVGFNYRLSNLLAAVGRGQLQVLDERVAQRRRIFDAYRRGLGDMPGISFMPEYAGSNSNRWLTCTLVDSAQLGKTSEDLRLYLETENIESRRIWMPMHLQPVNDGCRVRGGQVAELIFDQGLCLPSGSSLTAADLERVISAIRCCVGRNRVVEAA